MKNQSNLTSVLLIDSLSKLNNLWSSLKSIAVGGYFADQQKSISLDLDKINKEFERLKNPTEEDISKLFDSFYEIDMEVQNYLSMVVEDDQDGDDEESEDKNSEEHEDKNESKKSFENKDESRKLNEELKQKDQNSLELLTYISWLLPHPLKRFTEKDSFNFIFENIRRYSTDFTKEKLESAFQKNGFYVNPLNGKIVKYEESSKSKPLNKQFAYFKAHWEAMCAKVESEQKFIRPFGKITRTYHTNNPEFNFEALDFEDETHKKVKYN